MSKTAYKRKSFLLYTDYKECFDYLSDEAMGKLFKAILDYAYGDTPEELHGELRIAFSFIKCQMDRDAEKYNRKANKNDNKEAAKETPVTESECSFVKEEAEAIKETAELESTEQLEKKNKQVYTVTEKDLAVISSSLPRIQQKNLPLHMEEGGKSIVYFASDYTDNLKPLLRNQGFY